MNSQAKIVTVSTLKTAREYQAELKAGQMQFKQKVVVFPLLDRELIKQK